MTKQIDQVALQRLRSCFSMLGTDNDAEALNALSRCKESLTRHGLSWNDLTLGVDQHQASYSPFAWAEEIEERRQIAEWAMNLLADPQVVKLTPAMLESLRRMSKVENAITSSEMKKVMLAWDRVVNEKKRTY